MIFPIAFTDGPVYYLHKSAFKVKQSVAFAKLTN